ncbi:hypothetical protein EMIT0232MI5_110235 [Pseudomonas sp. IT-232MI5]
MYCVGSFGPQLERFAAFFPLFDGSPLWHGGKQRQTAFSVRKTLLIVPMLSVGMPLGTLCVQ